MICYNSLIKVTKRQHFLRDEIRVILSDESKSMLVNVKNVFPIDVYLLQILPISPKFSTAQPVERFELNLSDCLSSEKLKQLDHLRNHLLDNMHTKLLAKEYYEAYVTTVIDSAHIFVVPLGRVSETCNFKSLKSEHFVDTLLKQI